jgi:hypothetical protein
MESIAALYITRDINTSIVNIQIKITTRGNFQCITGFLIMSINEVKKIIRGFLLFWWKSKYLKIKIAISIEKMGAFSCSVSRYI